MNCHRNRPLAFRPQTKPGATDRWIVLPLLTWETPSEGKWLTKRAIREIGSNAKLSWLDRAGRRAGRVQLRRLSGQIERVLHSLPDKPSGAQAFSSDVSNGINVTFTVGIVAAQMPSSSPLFGSRCASFLLSSVAMALSSFRSISGFGSVTRHSGLLRAHMFAPFARGKERRGFYRLHPKHTATTLP